MDAEGNDRCIAWMEMTLALTFIVERAGLDRSIVGSLAPAMKESTFEATSEDHCL